MRRRTVMDYGLLAGAGLAGYLADVIFSEDAMAKSETFAVTYTDAEWRARLTPEQYRVLRQEGTEPPFQNAYYNNKKPGIYQDRKSVV